MSAPVLRIPRIDADLARLPRLVARLEPRAHAREGACAVPGCVHLRGSKAGGAAERERPLAA